MIGLIQDLTLSGCRGGARDGNLGVQAAAVLGCLLHHPRVLAAARGAGGPGSLLPALGARGCKLALTGALYLLSCLAEFPAARAELEAAGGVAALLVLLRSSADVSVQARPAALYLGLGFLGAVGVSAQASALSGRSRPNCARVLVLCVRRRRLCRCCGC